MNLIACSLDKCKLDLQSALTNLIEEVGVRYATVDDLHAVETTEQVARCFPDTHEMRLMDSFREKKFSFDVAFNQMVAWTRFSGLREESAHEGQQR